MTSLARIRLRIARADEHLATLDDERCIFLDDIRGRVRSRLDTDIPQWLQDMIGPDRAVCHIYVDADPPPARWGVIVSEVLHQLRAALDNLMCALVVHRGNIVTKSTAFPIAIESDEWKNAESMWRGIGADDLAVLKALQPVHRSDVPEDDLLAILRRLSNYDKHEALGLVYATSRGILGGLETGKRLKIEAVQDCIVPGPFTGSPTVLIPYRGYADIATVHVQVTGPNPQVRMKGDPSFDVALTGAGRTLALKNLRQLSAETVRVVKRFTPAFRPVTRGQSIPPLKG